MLVLSRRCQEQIDLPGLNVSFKVLAIRGNRVQIGIEAPSNIEITRPGTTRPDRALDNDHTLRRMMTRSSAVTSMTAIANCSGRMNGA